MAPDIFDTLASDILLKEAIAEVQSRADSRIRRNQYSQGAKAFAALEAMRQLKISPNR